MGRLFLSLGRYLVFKSWQPSLAIALLGLMWCKVATREQDRPVTESSRRVKMKVRLAVPSLC